jgi:hypothetical protein
MKQKIFCWSLFVTSLVLCVGIGGCEHKDPTQLELETGKNLDIARTTGEVMSLGTSYFVGDQPHTKDEAGKPYQWVVIKILTRPRLNLRDFTFNGITKEVYDSLEVGMKLPGSSSFMLSKLNQVNGSIVDMCRELHNNQNSDSFFLVIKTSEGVFNKYEVDMYTYYRVLGYMAKANLSLPLKLPLDISLDER